MIETVEGVDNAYEIAAMPGIDVVILGNSDLTSFSGFPQTDDRIRICSRKCATRRTRRESTGAMRDFSSPPAIA